VAHTVLDLAALVRERQPCVVLTGAGISTESGIPEVHPVTGLPDEAVSAGVALAILNRGPTPFDHLASVRIDAKAGETLSDLVEALA
jgi:NAD-dependent SIR2 family protein deacetylase